MQYENNSIHLSIPSKKQDARLKILKILIVEDNLEAQSTLCELLEMLDYFAEGASTAEEALNKLPNFDILLTDINLPGMSGLELAKISSALYPSKPIIISSGMDITSQLQSNVQLMPKPFTMAELTEVLAKAKYLLHSI